MTTAVQCKNSSKPCTLAGFEPGIFCSVGRRGDHYATPPGLPPYYILEHLILFFQDHGDKIVVSEFEAAFAEKYKSALCPGQYGFPSLLALIQSPIMAEEHFLIRGRGSRKMIWLVIFFVPYLRSDLPAIKIHTNPV
jgi:hypothetical protein